MAVNVNLAILEATRFSSDSIGPLVFAVHALEAGIYAGEVYAGDRRAGVLEISVVEDRTSPQVSIDLCKLNGGGPEAVRRYSCGLHEGKGYALFFSSHGATAYRVILSRDGEPVYDSRRPAEGDLWGLTLLRPGPYEMRTGARGAAGRIEVKPLERAKDGLPASQAAQVRVTGEKLDPAKLSIRSGDGVVFTLDGKTTLQLAFAGSDKDGDAGSQFPRRVPGLRPPAAT